MTRSACRPGARRRRLAGRARVEPQARDHRVGVAGVGEDRDPLAGPVSPQLMKLPESSGDFEQARRRAARRRRCPSSRSRRTLKRGARRRRCTACLTILLAAQIACCTCDRRGGGGGGGAVGQQLGRSTPGAVICAIGAGVGVAVGYTRAAAGVGPAAPMRQRERPGLSGSQGRTPAGRTSRIPLSSACGVS